MSNDEQIEEIEVLQSIYPDELTILSPTSFRIQLVLDPPPTPNNTEESAPPILLLHVSYPPTYPDAAPDLDITLDPSTPGTAALSFPGDKAPLLETLSSVIDENLGMAMVFTLASSLKDAAEALIGERASQKERERESVQRREEEKEMEKFRGEMVTREKFLEWREKFVAEMEEARRAAKEAEEEERGRKPGATPAVKEKKLTGKEMWERGLVGEAGDDEEEEGAGVEAGVAALKV
ncbi:putative RWD domain protein [Geopyxis carbonaria]|nr:putative RWD domain protein [Geopyxis carbonaria]